MGAGNDTFVWNPGDGSDTVEGQGGTDTMLFNGANVAENFDISANGSRVRFTRDVGNVTMDLNGVEQVNFNALGGADTITVNDLTGTDVTDVNLDLAGTPAAAPATAQADTVIVNGTHGADDDHGRRLGVRHRRSSGLAADGAHHRRSDAASDQLTVNGLGGDDTHRRLGARRPARSA